MHDSAQPNRFSDTAGWMRSMLKCKTIHISLNGNEVKAKV